MRLTDHLSRRRVLGASALAATTALTGCAGVLNQVADQFLEDVNVLNDTDSEVSGTILVTASEETILDREFTLSGADDTDNGDNGNIRPYADIWDGAGSYTTEISLKTSIDGESNGSATVTVDDPDEEMLLVGLGLQDADEPIVFRVGESFTDVVES
ncbi:hypothetical protein [Halovenus sp. HT40]|uniref:hypothetical protein n=1 Tax=Halovenus sp. HT40 TaxID=3126691 RepID=UPI00300EA860